MDKTTENQAIKVLKTNGIYGIVLDVRILCNL